VILAARIARRLLGGSPRSLLFLTVPTLLAVALDLVLRARTLWGYALQGKAIYLSSVLISAALWMLPLSLVAACARLRRGGGGTRRSLGFAGATALSVLFVMPVATMGYGGQALYHRVFHSYMGRDTLRLGVALRGTVSDWFVAWGSKALLGGMFLVGALVAGLFLRLTWKAAEALAPPFPALLPVTFAAAVGCLWYDQLDSRFLQAATPDACFVHGVVHALRVRLSGQEWIRKGVSQRAPAPLPPLSPALAPGSTRLPNVLLILTESVRADAVCSDPPPLCEAPFLDTVVPDRASLGLLTSQTPNTFSAFLLLTTGLDPTVDFASAHAAPVLWEVARAVGYRTAYVSAQNPKYEDFGTFVERAGIDELVTATDLGGVEQEQLGAPDERATHAALEFVRRAVAGSAPYLAVVHLSNTHAPYRVDPTVMPFLPSSPSGLRDAIPFHNRYRNSVRLQERTVADLVRQVRGLAAWDDTVVLFLSDHGEQFREHGGLYHNHSLYDEELRVPGWIAGGKLALSPSRRAALASYEGHRTFTQDVHATVIDLVGAYDARSTLPLSTQTAGRSLLRPRPRASEPAALLATSTAVWEPDDARYGVMRGDQVLISSAARSWSCFDLKGDPEQRDPHPAETCGPLWERAKQAFAGVDVPP
jgi:hypothetical protein